MLKRGIEYRFEKKVVDSHPPDIPDIIRSRPSNHDPCGREPPRTILGICSFIDRCSLFCISVDWGTASGGILLERVCSRPASDSIQHADFQYHPWFYVGTLASTLFLDRYGKHLPGSSLWRHHFKYSDIHPDDVVVQQHQRQHTGCFALP